MHLSIKAAARDSLLSRAQVREIEDAMRQQRPQVNFDIVFLKTQGDKDLQTSLRTLDKTDFFTKEIDEGLLQGIYDIGIHSAKDLPDPLPKGLVVIALTSGLNPADALVLRPGESLQNLLPGAKIATSSERREQVVKGLRQDLTFMDLRGTIHQRLAKLETGEADGVVVAEAALVRLNLTHLNRILLPGETAPLQGKLAIVSREGDERLGQLFSVIDARR